MSKPVENEADFVLKHRIAGAAFLLFFGALFLPWLLGPPSEAIKAAETPEIVSDVELTSSEIEDELLAAIESEKEEPEEQVYISKITPFDDDAEQAGEQQANSDVNSQKDVAAQTESQVDIKPKAQVLAVEAEDKPKDEKVAEVKTAEAQVPEVKTAKVSIDEKPEPPEKIEVGWVVQVGVFEKAEGVSKELADLRAKGFTPGTSEMETNQKSGKATRIWLGPYSRRVDAAKAKASLTEKTGKAGYIRAYP